MRKEILTAIIKRLLTSLIVIFLIITFIFLLLRVAPGDPVQKFVSPQLSPDLSKQILHSFNLDKPVIVQYFYFVKNILIGDFGLSYNFRQPVLSVIKNYFLFTLIFASISFFLELVISYILVKISIRKPGRKIDKLLSQFSLVVFVIPSFVLGLILVYIFSIKLDLLPTSGIKSIYHEDFNLFNQILDYAQHMILPVITLSLSGIAVFYRYLVESVKDNYKKAYVSNLRANGYTENEIFRNHVIPNAVRPLISVAGIELGVLLGGTLITEVIFSLPGMGRLTIDAIFNRDYPLIIGCSFIAALMMIISNLMADLIKIKLDKRLVTDLLQ